MLRKLYESVIPYETRLRFYKWRHPAEFRELRTKVMPSEKGDFSLKPFDEHKCIFIHITKTAGTSVARSLFNYLPYHYTAIQYRVIYGKETFNEYFKFAFVRNPWDRAYSAFRYLKAGGWNENDKAWAEQNLNEFTDFNDFAVNWLNSDNIKKHLHFKPQFEFVCDTNNNILTDYIARFENINEEFNILTNKLGLNSTLGKHNTNPAQGYTEIYSDKAIESVANVYKTDIDLFNYTFLPNNQ